MINPFLDTNWKPKRADLRDFARTFMLAFPVFASVLLLATWWRTGAWATWPLWVGGIGVTVGAVCWLVLPIARPVYFFWHFLGCCMAALVSNLLLALVFYAVVTPVALVLKVLGKDPLQRKWDRSATTYWKKAERSEDPRQYFRQF